MMDTIFKGMIVLLGVAFVFILVYLIPQDIQRTARGEAIAEQMGCKYLGSARDMPSVKFLDCNGEIKLIRVK